MTDSTLRAACVGTVIGVLLTLAYAHLSNQVASGAPAPVAPAVYSHVDTLQGVLCYVTGRDGKSPHGSAISCLYNVDGISRELERQVLRSR